MSLALQMRVAELETRMGAVAFGPDPRQEARFRALEARLDRLQGELMALKARMGKVQALKQEKHADDGTRTA